MILLMIMIIIVTVAQELTTGRGYPGTPLSDSAIAVRSHPLDLGVRVRKDHTLAVRIGRRRGSPSAALL